jgi:hypothetical protein
MIEMFSYKFTIVSINKSQLKTNFPTKIKQNRKRENKFSHDI